MNSSPVVGSAGSDWSIQGTGDFNKDGHPDILWRNANGTVEIWLMNGATIVGQPVIGNADSSLTIEGVGDFNHDGFSDILLRNTNGTVEVWLMTGTTTTATIASQSVISSATSDWTIQRIADFNGDGNSDILWRNTDGTVELWLISSAGLSCTYKRPTSWTVGAVVCRDTLTSSIKVLDGQQFTDESNAGGTGSNTVQCNNGTLVPITRTCTPGGGGR